MSRSILWFRHGLRLHDNPALLEAIRSAKGESVTFYPVFIFDGISAGTKVVGYNRMKFLLESLADLNEQLKKLGGPGLLLFRGDPLEIFKKLWQELGINKICFEFDCEPIWNERDTRVKMFCNDVGIEVIEKVSHTLWDPMDVIRTNGGFPPLTYQMFLHTVNVIGQPPRPVEAPDFSHVDFGKIPQNLNDNLGVFDDFPKPEDFGIQRKNLYFSQYSNKWKGGEKKALKQLQSRLKVEEIAFSSGSYLPNQANPDLLSASTSLSVALRFGCLSVRNFYYSIHDLFNEVQARSPHKFPGGHHLTGQLIWREYFYTMSVKNPNYGQMKNNPICINIPWRTSDDEAVLRWKLGRTGIPIIDAAMRQLLAEGWLHHSLRNIVATFLTRTGLWISWEVGLQHFLKYLLDADWSVCAGNWMWVSSSAFETLLDSSRFSIIAMAYRLDPKGDYVKRYIPELRNYPREYIHEPWKCPRSSQEGFNCIIGEKYPEPIIDLKRAMVINANRMKHIRESLIESHPHVRPSNEDEIRTFFWIADNTMIKCQN